jgi:hypothetical protein
VAAAWFGLIGVVVGGVLTGLITFVLDRARERREARRARVIARSENAEATDAVDVALNNSRWPAGWNTKTWAQSWGTIRSPLASTMDEHEFQVVARSYGFMELLQNGLASGERDFGYNDRKFLEDAGEALRAAEPHLARG